MEYFSRILSAVMLVVAYSTEELKMTIIYCALAVIFNSDSNYYSSQKQNNERK